jgi:cytochrome c2
MVGDVRGLKGQVFRLALGIGAVVWAGVGVAGSEGEVGARWGKYWEDGQPFLGMVVDGRGMGGGISGEDNLTPRGIVLRLEHGMYVCFDVDLLRFSLGWVVGGADEGAGGVTQVSMSAGSYHDPTRKAPPGQKDLPRPVGEVVFATDVLPGAAAGGGIERLGEDPRPACPAPGEVGRGGLPRGWGRWRGIDLAGGVVSLVYEVGGVEVRESLSAVRAGGQVGMVRRVEVGEAKVPIELVLGAARGGWAGRVVSGQGGEIVRVGEAGAWRLRLEGGMRREVVVVMGEAGALDELATAAEGAGRWVQWRGLRWPEEIEVVPKLGDEGAAVVMDELGVPMENPWRRNIRAAALDFFGDGRAAVVTYDGDVWVIDGWDGRAPGREARWRRFAAGLHEPMGLAVKQDQVYVADRNGIQRLEDRTGDGEADWYECVSNQHGQTAETREFASGLKVLPDGSFVISKGGQSVHSLGHHNGTVLRVSADGGEVEVLGWGLRQPFVGVHPERGWVTASDQQGQWVPSTPLHLVRDGRYYGFVHEYRKNQPYKADLEPPMTWMPHAFNQSGAGQVWAPGGTMGALSGKLIHLGYEKSAVYVVGMEERGGGFMGAVVSQLPMRPTAALLGGAASGLDGQVYLTGFRIWDSSGAPDLSNVFRLRPGRGTLPVAVGGAAGVQGVRLDFAVELDGEAAGRVGNYAVERWNYQRTEKYGSGHFRLDGRPGSEPVGVVGAALSKDGRSVFLALGDMREAMQLGVTYTVRSAGGEHVAGTSYLTVHGPMGELDLAGDGFVGEGVSGLVARAAAAGPLAMPEGEETLVDSSAEFGAKLSEALGCIACHSVDGSTEGRSGPSWKGLAGAVRELEGGGEVVADDEYLRESIWKPAEKIVRGYGDGEVGMPAYEGILSEGQVQAIIRFIKSLD